MICTNNDHYVNALSTIKKERREKKHFLLLKGFLTNDKAFRNRNLNILIP